MKFDLGIQSQVSKISAVTWFCQPRKPQHVHIGPDKSCKLRIRQRFDYQRTHISLIFMSTVFCADENHVYASGILSLEENSENSSFTLNVYVGPRCWSLTLANSNLCKYRNWNPRLGLEEDGLGHTGCMMTRSSFSSANVSDGWKERKERIRVSKTLFVAHWSTF
jgi:hypothetical protein